MVIAFYTWLPSVLGFLMLGVYTLIVYRRAVWRWIVPGIPAMLLALPLIISKLNSLAYQVNKPIVDPPASFQGGIANYFSLYTGFNYVNYPIIIWVILSIAATLLIFYRWRQEQRLNWAFLAWAFGLPLLMYLLNPWLKFFDNHYSMALMIGMAVWIGWGLALLPRWPAQIVMVGLLGLMLVNFDLHYPPYFWRPWNSTMTWLSEHIQPDDVLLIDPNKGVDKYFEWAYYSKVYFPEGLHFVTNPDGYRRVWYITPEGKRDPATDAAVRKGRVERNFVGPADFFFRLYEAPPDPTKDSIRQRHAVSWIDFLDSTAENTICRAHSSPIILVIKFGCACGGQWTNSQQPITALLPI